MGMGKETPNLAITSLVFGIISILTIIILLATRTTHRPYGYSLGSIFLLIYILSPFVALILGFVSLRRIGRNEASVGRRISIIGIVLGVVGLLFLISSIFVA